MTLHLICDISFLVVTPVKLMDEVYQALQGRDVALQSAKMPVLTAVPLS